MQTSEKKLPIEEIVVEFVCYRQKEMKTFSSQRRYCQNMGGSEHCYVFVCSSDHRCPYGMQ